MTFFVDFERWPLLLISKNDKKIDKVANFLIKIKAFKNAYLLI